MVPIVGIIMGSDSDFQVMKEASEILNYFQIPHEVTIVSAHLPGMAAALTALPVIGVPVKSNTLSGIDSLYSIVQMPSGVPVATVAINGAKNAGILAAQILAVSDEKLYNSIENYKKELEDLVMKKVEDFEKEW